MNAVTLRQVRLVLVWVTVFQRVNHLGTEAGTHYSGLLSLSHPFVGRHNEYATKAGGVNSHIAFYTSVYPWSCSVGFLQL